MIENIKTFSEEFIGENKVRYKYIYYIGILKNHDKIVYIDKNNKDQFTEIKNIKWLTKKDSLSIIRDYHHTRKDVINKIFYLISNNYSIELFCAPDHGNTSFDENTYHVQVSY